MNFLKIVYSAKKGELYPDFKIVPKSSDVMVRGRDFYAFWDEEDGKWCTDEFRLVQLIDKELAKKRDELFGVMKDEDAKDRIHVKWMEDASSGSIDKWHKYVQRQMRDNFVPLDSKIIFANTPVSKENYSSHCLPYDVAAGPTPAWDEIVSTLYSPENQHKIEWAIGSIVSGGAKDLQKFFVFYGLPGTGKSTILNIIQKMFEIDHETHEGRYWAPFMSEELASKNDSFAMEAFKTNPLIAIQHDGDLSSIYKNATLNTLVSHEVTLMNEKNHPKYPFRFQGIILMGTNKPVEIKDSSSGLIRRLIDIQPSNKKIPRRRYNKLMTDVEFELGAIAHKCKIIFEKDPYYYDDYVALDMLDLTNDVYFFVRERFDEFAAGEYKNGITLANAWNMYKDFCLESNVKHPVKKIEFREDLKNYFKHYDDRIMIAGKTYFSYFTEFKTDKFIDHSSQKNSSGEKSDDHPSEDDHWLKFGNYISEFDKLAADYPAQYATLSGTPEKAWDNVRTILKDLDTHRLHYVKVPEHHIVVDFDLTDENGNKSLERNLEATKQWPATYAEVSKGGSGIHLHYIYTGEDPSKLSRVFDEKIEVKVFTGKSSLRRKLTLCNDLPIYTISAGLPMKKPKVIDFQGVKNEAHIRAIISKCLKKEYEPHATAPMVDLIGKVLDEAWDAGITYDVSNLKEKIIFFAGHSSHQADRCLKRVKQMHFQSESEFRAFDADKNTIIFYDVEVFPNLFVIVWKAAGKPCVQMINPTPEEVEQLSRYNLVGFNCRRYDNHIMYARMQGYSNEELYSLSQRIINGDRNAFFGNAYNMSYTDIYDYAKDKQSLKKWEIQLGIHHQELGLPWDQPVDESLWTKVAEYCVNDVEATEATWNATQADFEARKILVAMANMFAPGIHSCENDTTNTLTGRIIFGNNKHPQSEFVYTDLSKMFPGYYYDNGQSHYRGEVFGEGGYVFSRPGMYHNVVTFDVASMHPHSVIALNLFGERYTKRFEDLVNLRILVKHGDFDSAKQLFNGLLAPYLADKSQAKALAGALKIAINSVYGLTAAKFENPFRDPRNIDNIVAKRGELFMIDLKNEVEKLGANVIHIKTDSIKIVDPTPEISEFVMNFGKKYGYDFEIEAEYERMCLVNKAVYIAKEKNGGWTATGDQFKVPYVFKTLFSREEITFDDVCETKSVSTSIYLDMNERLLDRAEVFGSKKMAGDRPFEKVEGTLYSADTPLHDYKFVGKVGQFCPVKPGYGGGMLMRRMDNGKFSSVNGSKGFRWLESEDVRKIYGDSWREAVDTDYYISQIDAAVAAISEYGDYEAFVAT